MKYVVSLDYKRFEFDTFAAAGEFAYAAKSHSVNKDLSVEIKFEEDPEEEQEA